MRSTVQHGGRQLAVLLMVVALVWWAPAGVISPGVGVASAQEDGPPPTPAAYFGNVTIDGEPAPEGTVVEAEVGGNVTGSITVDEAGVYGGGDALDEKLTVGGDYEDNGTAVQFYVDNENIERTRVNITDPETVLWEAGDVEQVDLRASSQEPLFQVDIADAPAAVVAGEAISLTLNLTNTGAGAGEKTTNASVDGEVRASSTDALDPGEQTQVALDVPTAVSDAGTVTVSVDTGDDSASTSVEVKRPPEFAVALGLNQSAVAPGQEINGTVNVTNVGGQSGTQNVSIAIGETTIKTPEIQLPAGESQNLTFAYTPGEDEAGTRTVSAASQDASASSVVTVSEPASFQVDLIESESNLDLVAGETTSIVADVTNTGELEATKQVNATWGGEQITTKDLTLEPGEVTEFNATYATSDNGSFDVTVETPEDTESVEATVENRPAFLDVTIDAVNDSVDEPLPENTTNLSVDLTVENLGTNSTTDTVIVSINSEERKTSEVALTGGEKSAKSLNVPVHPGDGPQINLTVSSDDDSAISTIPVNSVAQFETTVVEASNKTDSLTTETTFAPTINVTNIGEQAGNGLLEVRFNGSVETNVSVDGLGPGETTTLVEPEAGFGLNASTDGTKIVEAQVLNNGTETVDDVSTRTVAIGDAPTFEITQFSVTPSPTVDQGETITVEATVNNTGDAEGNQTAAIEVGGTTVTATAIQQLGADENTTISADYFLRSEDVGELSVSVSTDDDAQQKTLTVRELAEFEVTDVRVPSSVIAGESADVTVQVENVGGLAENTTDLRLYAEGSQVGTKTISLSAGEVRLVEFDSGEVTPSAAGSLGVTAATADDQGQATIEVGTPGELRLTLLSVTDPVTTSDQLKATVLAENVGDGTAAETVSLKVDGSITQQQTLSVAGGESTTATFSTSISRSLNDDESVTADVAVESQRDRVADAVTIQDPPDDPYFRVSVVDAPGSVLDLGQNVTLGVNVTNIGDKEDTQDVNLSVGGTNVDSESVTLDGSNTTTVELNVSTSTLGVGENAEYTVSSPNASISESVTVIEPTPGTPELVDVEVLTGSPSQNSPLEVNATVRNAGDLELNQTVTLSYSDEDETSAEIDSLGPGNETTVTLSVTPPAEPRAGTWPRDLTVDAGEETRQLTTGVDFGSIQSGIDAAAADGTVMVAPGTYTERDTIVVDKAGLEIRTIGLGPSPTVTSPRYANDALSIQAQDVSVSNLRFAGDGTGTAVTLASDGARLSNLQLVNWTTGVAETSGTNEIYGSTIRDTGTGMVLDGAGESTVAYSQVAGSTDRGIVVLSEDNQIRGATITGAPIGVELLAQGTQIRFSTIRGNDDVGLRVKDVPGDVNGVPSAAIHQSALEANGIHAFVDNSSVNATTNWWGGPGLPDPNADYVVRSDLKLGDPLDSRPESQFEVQSDFVDTTVRGTQLTIDATVENTGSKADLQTVELVVNGTAVASSDVELESEESKTVDFTYTPTVSDGDHLGFEVRSLDDATSESFAVLDPAAFALPAIAVPDTIDEDETLSVTPTIENVGEANGTATVELVIDGSSEDTAQVSTLAGGATVDKTLTYSPSSPGKLNVTVVVGDAVLTRSVTVDDVTYTPPGGGGDEQEPDDEEPVDDEPDAPDDEPTPPDAPPETGEEPGDIQAILPPQVELPEDVAPERAEVNDLAMDDETNTSTVSFSTNASVAAIEIEAAVEGNVSVVEFDQAPDTTGDTPGDTVGVTQITVPENVTEEPATITQRVSVETVESVGAETDELTVTRFDDAAGEWQVLDTEVLAVTNDTVKLEAETPGFSYFAVTAIDAPTAALDAPAEVRAGEEVTFDASGSTDDDSEIVAYDWTIDGEAVDGDETLTYTFDASSDATVEVTVENEAGKTSTSSAEVTVLQQEETVTTTPDEPTTERTTTVTQTTPGEAGGPGAVLIGGILVVVIALLAALYLVYGRE